MGRTQTKKKRDAILKSEQYVEKTKLLYADFYPFSGWSLEFLNLQFARFVLAQVEDDHAQAARVLGISPSTLYRMLKKAKSP